MRNLHGLCGSAIEKAMNCMNHNNPSSSNRSVIIYFSIQDFLLNIHYSITW